MNKNFSFDFTLGIIGGGAMAEAMLKALTKVVPRENIYLSDHKATRAEELHARYGIHAGTDDDFVKNVDILLFAVKPKDAKDAMRAVAPHACKKTILSIVAGLSLYDIEAIFPDAPIYRIMPNTPLSVGEGMSAYACGMHATDVDTEIVHALLSAAGKAIRVAEHLMDAVTGLSGSGPAYAFLMIEALADGGVAAGLPRKDATLAAAQTLLGAARMVIETGEHPAVLLGQVTSPAGTTIEGVRTLEKAGVRTALIEAVLSAAERSKALGNPNAH